MTENKSTVRILKSSSYLCVFDPSKEQGLFLNNFAKKINVRIFEVRDLNDFLDLVFQVKHNVGCFINTASLMESDKAHLAQELSSLSCPVIFNEDLKFKKSNFHYTNELAEAQKIFKGTLDVLMPKRLDELTVFAANNVLKYLASKEELKFSKVENLENFTCDFIISCQVQSTNLFGYCFLKVNTNSIDQVLDREYVESEYLMMDFTKEMVNQFWGIVCQNIRKLGINPKIGLPSALDVNGHAGIAKTYIPSVCVKDDKGIFSFEIGFTALDHTVPFDLSNVEFTVEFESDGELELL